MSIIEYVPVDRPVANPYPDSAAEIVGFRFDTGLHLMRPRNAARLYKDGEDAAYVLSARISDFIPTGWGRRL